MIVYPAISPLAADRHAPEQVIGMAGLGDRHHPDSLIVFTGIRNSQTTSKPYNYSFNCNLLPNITIYSLQMSKTCYNPCNSPSKLQIFESNIH
jgi:hypothetical protein